MSAAPAGISHGDGFRARPEMHREYLWIAPSRAREPAAARALCDSQRMSRGLLAALLIGVLVLVAFAFLTRGNAKQNAVVARVVDGDTIELVGGQRVRLVQIDSPE